MRELRLIAHGALSTSHPIMAHIIPIRRCNLACTYCNEYDDFSPPVPADVVIRRINQLADLGTSIITLSGGEPMLHPDLDRIIAAMRRRGVLACMITNGYLLMPDRIQRLNRAGLDHMQISIDNVMPDDVSKKSLKVLDKKLQMLAEHAEFHVNINSVVGGGIHNPEDDAGRGSKRRRGSGLHGDGGHPCTIRRGPVEAPGGSRRGGVSRDEESSKNRKYAQLNYFQDAIAQGKPAPCGAAAPAPATCIICEDGLVHYCSQQRGYPGHTARPIHRPQTSAANT